MWEAECRWLGRETLTSRFQVPPLHRRVGAGQAGPAPGDTVGPQLPDGDRATRGAVTSADLETPRGTLHVGPLRPFAIGHGPP